MALKQSPQISRRDQRKETPGTLNLVGDKRAIVVGAGAVGLMSSWALQRAGYEVTLLDPTPGRGAVWQAGGMLAPVSESHFGEEGLVAFLVEAARCWDRTAPLLETDLGDIGFQRCGTILVALDAGDRAELTRRAELMVALGLSVQEVSRDEIQELEPNLSPRTRSAILAPEDHQVDNRWLVTGLLGYLRSSGAEIIEQRVTSVGDGTCRLEDGRELSAEILVLSPGARLGEIEGLEPGVLPVVRPVKGHIVRLGGPPRLNRTVRAMVHGRPLYLVPRLDGELVIGATVEEVGFDTTVRAGEVHRLLDDARLIAPGIDELELLEASAGLRPGSPDNAPTILRISPRTIAAVGHYRNGVLLAPITAELVLALAEGQPHPADRLLEGAHP